MKKPTYAQLKRQVLELEAQSIWNLKNARREIKKTGENNFKASACIISITALGGREVVNAFAIRDGLSKETIDAIIKDIERTCEGYGYPLN